jgi:thiol:disulfide interchange protein DsbD
MLLHLNSKLLSILSVLPLLPLEAAQTEETFDGKGVQTRLLCEASTIAPGQTFTVALILSHHPGFHTYWKNPGTVGMPTDLKWELPEGFRAGALIWQSPERSKMFKYDVYGYEKNATILTEITAPKNLASENVALTAKASWMACSDSGCNPGYHTFRLRLQVGDRTVLRPEVSKLVRQARSRLPKPLPSFRARAKAKGKKVQLLIEGKAVDKLRDMSNLHFFSSLNHYLIDPVQNIRRKKNMLLITLSKADYAPDEIKRVEGVLHAAKGWPGVSGEFQALIQAEVD